MFRLIGFLVIFTLTAGGFMFVDYKMSARWSGREDAGGLTFREYLGGLSGRISRLLCTAVPPLYAVLLAEDEGAVHKTLGLRAPNLALRAPHALRTRNLARYGFRILL